MRRSGNRARPGVVGTANERGFLQPGVHCALRRGHMWRRISIAFPLVALLSVTAPACGHFGSTASSPPTVLPALALSVPADAVYLVDARTGQRRTIASRLSDFQGGYAVWAPDHRRLAYGDNGIVLFEPRSNRETKLIHGKGLSMPAWSRD